METLILNSEKQENIELCAQVIKNGGLVAIPTETVYGLAANALDEKAVLEIFTTKGRQPDNPLIVHIATLEKVKNLVIEIPNIFYELADTFWPGPLTMIMKKSKLIPDNVSAGLDTVAIRMPEHPAALALIRASSCPIAAPSANPSGQPSPTNASHVKNDLDGKIPYILDGGDCRVGLESTVIDISEDIPRILRPGGITYEEIKTILGHVETDSSITTESPKSPGMKYRHYAPKSPMTAILGSPDKTTNYIKNHIKDNMAALMFDDFAFDHPNIVTYGASEDFTAQAAHLFDALRTLDNMNVVSILAQMPCEKGLGQAVANRLKKAAGGRLVNPLTPADG